MLLCNIASFLCILMSSIVLIVFYLWHHPYYICNHLYDSIVLCYVYKLDCNIVVVQFIITLPFELLCLSKGSLTSLPVESPTTDLAAALKIIPTECQVTLTADVRDTTISSSPRSSCKS